MVFIKSVFSHPFGKPYLSLIPPEQYDALQREIVDTEQELQNLQREAVNSQTALVKIGEAGASIEKVGDKIATVGTNLTKYVTVPILGLSTAAVKTTADFDASMSKVSAVSGATGEDLQALRDKAREMGSQTKFSASEAADAMNYMAMAGWKTEDMLNGVEGIMNLAAASGEDLASTSDIVTDTLTALGMTADDSAHFADILAAASSNANTNVALMGESFKYVAPVAGAMGASAEDLVAAALGPLLVVIGKTMIGVGKLMQLISNLPTIIAGAKSAFAAFSGAIGGISAPVVAVIAVIAALVAAFVHLWKTNEDFRNKITAIWEQIKSIFSGFCQGIVDRINALGFDFKNIGEVIKAVWDGLCKFLKPIFEGTFQQIANIFKAVTDIILNLLDGFIGIFTGDWDKVWNTHHFHGNRLHNRTDHRIYGQKQAQQDRQTKFQGRLGGACEKVLHSAHGCGRCPHGHYDLNAEYAAQIQLVVITEEDIVVETS